MEVRIEGLRKVYPGRRGSGAVVALEEASLTAAAGEFVCLLGPSGCGKSTILQIVAGLESATAGTVRFAAGGARDDGASGPRTSLVFQEFALFPWRTVRDNVAYSLEMRGIGKAERFARAAEFIRTVGLTGFENKYPHELSGGMRQRVALARSLAADPGVLLMDEPFGALDAQTRTLVQEELLTIWERSRKTVLFVTHSIEEAIILGDRILVMSARPGRIKAEITVPFARPRSEAVRGAPAFTELARDLWQLLRHETERAMLTERG